MDNQNLGRVIGHEAEMAFGQRVPGERAIDILDRLCKGRGGSVEWEAVDLENLSQTQPEYLYYTDPSPKAALGMLMVEAFAPKGLADLPKYAGVLVSDVTRAQAKEAGEALDVWWSEVQRPFAKRYGFR